MNNKYQDIIKLPRHVSTKRKHMPIKDRAAQFSPFAAVVGHESAVKEAARLTDKKKDLDESEKVAIDEKLHVIEMGYIGQVEITYFTADKSKEGGKYITIISEVKKIDEYQGTLILTDETEIFINDILHIEIMK